MKKFLFVLFVMQLFILSSNVFADDFSDALEKFKTNDLVSAKSLFEKSLIIPEKKAESLLMLSIIYGAEKNYEESFNKFVEFSKTCENPNPYLIALWVSPSINLDYTEKKDYQIEFFEELLESDKIDGKVRAYINEILAMHYDAVGDFDEANKYYEKIGATGNWQIIGEFENISESGFDNNYGPLEHPENSFEFTNEDGAKVKWFDAYRHQSGRWLRFNNHFYTNNSIFFAQTFCNSPIEQNVQLRVGVSGSVKVWVNDGLVLKVAKERNNGLDSYISNIKLNQGFNRILIQIGESEIERSNFLLRLTDQKGIALEGLEYTTEVHEYSKSSTNNSEPLEDATELFFRNKLKSEPDNMLNSILLAEILLHLDKVFEARKVIKASITNAPNCSYLHRQLANIYIREENQTDLSLLYENLKVIDPVSALSLDLFYTEAINSEKYDKAEEYLNTMKEKYGENENYLTKKMLLLSKMNKMDEYVKLIDYSYDKFPEEYSFVYSKAIMEYKANKRILKAIDALEDYLSDHFNIECVNLLAELYFQSNLIAKGIMLLENILEYQPNRIATLAELGYINYQLDKFKVAMSYYDECLAVAPYLDSYHRAKAELQEKMGRTSDAIESYKKVIYYNPNEYSTREKLDELLGNKKAFDYFTEPNFEQLFQNAPSKDNYPEDNSVILLDETHKVVYAGGGAEEKQFVLVKVFNSSGIDDWKEFYVSYDRNQRYKIEKAQVLKKNGSKLDAEISENHIVFTKLEENDGILIIYKLQNFQWGKLMNHFWDKHYFSNSYPIKNSRYSLLISPDIKFEYKFMNKAVEPEITKIDKYVKYDWEKYDIDAIVYEPAMPRSSDVLDILHLSTIPDWDFINKWYWDISKTKSKSDFEVKEVAEELFKDKTNLSEIDKVKMIYDYITKNIRYSSISFRQSGIIPQKASKVINTKIGDCKDVSTLFVALCSEIGINANLVLVNTRDNGLNDMPMPSMEFNHCIASVSLGQEKYYVELTSDYNPFSSIYGELKKSNYLEIDNSSEKKSLKLLDPANRKKNYIQRKSEVTFNNEVMTVKNFNIKSGGLAAIMRASYRDIGEKARNKSMLDILAAEYPNVNLTEFKLDDNLYNSSDSITYIYNFDVKSAFTKINNLNIFKMPLGDNMTSDQLFAMEERKFDVDLWNYISYDYALQELEINIPTGFKIAEVPVDVNYKSEYGDYSLKFKLEGSKLIIKRYFEMYKDMVTSQKYAEFKEFYQKIINADAQQLALQKL